MGELKRAMIFAAGKGTRLRPLTDHTPKALVKVAGVPMLERVIVRLRNQGFESLVVNVHHLADQIEDFLHQKKHFGLNIHISDERNQLLETGGGLQFARHLLDQEPFLVHNVDILSDLNIRTMWDFHRSQEAMATLAIRKRATSRYLMWDTTAQLCGWKNVKTQEVKRARSGTGMLVDFAFSGIHIIDPSFFAYLDQEGSFSIIPSYLEAAKTEKILGFVHGEGKWLDIGKPEQLRIAEAMFSGK